MIYELRGYVPMPGKGAALLARFENSTLALFDRLGFRVVDFWCHTDGSGELWYVMQWDSQEEMKAAWDAFRTNPDWVKAKTASEVDGPLTKTLTSIPLTRAPFFRGKTS